MKVEAGTTDSNAPLNETNEVAQSEQPQEPAIDYEKLYEESKKRLEQAEFSLYRKKKAEKLAKQQVQDEGLIDRESIHRVVEEDVATLVMAQREKDAEDVIEEAIMDISSDPAERKLIRFKYDNSINKTGFSRLAIKQDLEDAKFLANKPKYLKERTELAHAAISKLTTTNSGAGTNLDKPTPKDDLSKNFTAYDWEFMKKRHWSEEQIKRAASSIKK